MMPRIVTIVGTDGSGKTTLSSALVDLLREQGVDAAREWLGAESYITAPVRRLLRSRWRRLPTSEVSNQQTIREVAQKQAMVARHAWAKRLYLAVVLLDYRLQLTFKMHRNRRRDVLVADRYLFDVIVNLALTYGLSVQDTVELAQRQIAKLPLPLVRIFLRVEPEVSMQRKDDIPDVEYLRLRFAYYEAIAASFGFVVLDGTLPVEQNAKWLLDHVITSLELPYVHYVHANNADVGGADFVLVSMADQMRSSAGAYRTTVSLRSATAAARLHAQRGTPVLLAPVVRPQVTAGPRGLLKLAVKGPVTLAYFYRLFVRERPDIVHVNDLYDFLPALAARARRIPVVYHIRMIRVGFVRRVFRRLLPCSSDAMVSVSEAVRRVYDPEGSLGGRHRVVHDLGNPVLVDFADDVAVNQSRPGGLVPGHRLVIMVGRIQEWKGQHVFLDAISLLPADIRQRNAFVLVGGGVEGRSDYWGSPEYVDEVLAKAEQLSVQCLGDRDDVPDLLLSADVSVHCSIRPDPFPGVVIESLLAGTATIAADVGGVPEMIDSPEVGILYPPGDARALSDHLLQLLVADASPRSRFALAARSRALQLVSPEVIYDQIDGLYRDLIPQSGRRATRPRPSGRRAAG